MRPEAIAVRVVAALLLWAFGAACGLGFAHVARRPVDERDDLLCATCNDRICVIPLEPGDGFLLVDNDGTTTRYYGNGWPSRFDAPAMPAAVEVR